MANQFDTIVIGGGIGGSAAAFRAAQNGLRCLWLLGSKETQIRSRSQWVMNLDNIVGFHEDIIKNQVIKTLKKRKLDEAAEVIASEHYHIKNRAIIRNTLDRIREGYPDVMIVEEEAIELKKSEEVFEVKTPAQSFSGTAVILATGVMDEQPRIRKVNRKGQVEESPRWLYPFANREQVLYCIRCEGHLTRNDHVAVLGFTNVAAELAMMLHERYNNKISILTNGEKARISEDRRKILNRYGVEIITDPIVDFMSEGVKQLNGFIFSEGSHPGNGHEPVEVKFALVSLGLHRIYNDLARQIGARLLDEDQPEEKRHVWINHKGETSVPNLFVVGDAAKREDEPVMKQVYTAQEYAVRAVDTIDYRRRREIRRLMLQE